MNAQPRQCACCLRPYPQEQFVKILAPSADELITLQSRYLENISASVVHQVQNSDAFGEVRGQVRALAEVIADIGDKFDAANAQLQKVASYVDKHKTALRGLDLDARIAQCSYQCTELITKVRESTATYIDYLARRIEASGAETKRVAGSGLNELKAQVSEYLVELAARLDSAEAAQSNRISDLERRFDAQSTVIQVLHTNTQLLVDYFERRLIDVAVQAASSQSRSFAMEYRAPEPAEAECTQYQILDAYRLSVRVPDSLRSSARDVLQANSSYATSLGRFSGKTPPRHSSVSQNSADFYTANQQMHSSVNRFDAAQQTSHAPVADNSAQRTYAADDMDVEVYTSYRYGNTSVYAQPMVVSQAAQKSVVNQEILDSVVPNANRRSLASSTAQSDYQERLNENRPLLGSYKIHVHATSPAADIIRAKICQNDDLIEKYSCIEAISAVRPMRLPASQAAAASSASPSLFRSAPTQLPRSPHASSPGGPEFLQSAVRSADPIKKYDLNNLFKDVLNLQSKISPSQDNLTAAALQTSCVANCAQTDAITSRNPQLVLQKEKRLIDKVDDAYGYLQALSSTQK